MIKEIEQYINLKKDIGIDVNFNTILISKNLYEDLIYKKRNKSKLITLRKIKRYFRKKHKIKIKVDHKNCGINN